MHILWPPATVRWRLHRRAHDEAAHLVGWVPEGDALARIIPDADHELVVEYLHRSLTPFLSALAFAPAPPGGATLLLVLDREDLGGPVSLCRCWLEPQAFALLARPTDLDLDDVVERAWVAMRGHLDELLKHHNVPSAAHASVEVAA